ncbi:MAG TPA: tetratricopeptide repeat protein [Longimicrobium sp.]|nr:tetratricopeptide repeat protein [Longimicrobium sp.]
MRTRQRSRPAPSRSDRRQRVPPALTRGSERVAAISILDEIPGDLGLVLWRSARNVLLWAETPPSSRGELFTGEAGAGRVQLLAHVNAEPELRAPLLVIANLLARPATVGLLRLVNACRRIALWAEQRGALATALEFLQAASLASPDSASLAFGVGRLARRLADYDRAESWYTRAVVQARENQDWRSYASALAGIGNLHLQRGNYPAAKRVHLRCLHAATRHRVQELVAAAYHNLFDVEVETHAGAEAEILAEQALAAYEPHNPALRFLAYDLAFHWNLRGSFAGALKIARALEPVVEDLPIAPLVQGLIARAAGGLGDWNAYAVAVSRVDDLLSDPAVPEETAARTLLGVAHGAFNIGDTRSAARYAEEAMSIARKRSEGRVALEAEALMEAAGRASAKPGPEKAEVAVAPRLADQFVHVLSAPRARVAAGV